jgi:hypothetical protein
MTRRKQLDIMEILHFIKIPFIKIATKQFKRLKNLIEAGMMTMPSDIEMEEKFIG